MTIYASRTAESLNSDPTPIFNRTTGGRHTDDGYGVLEDDQIVWRPRPSFTPKTTHPANPILVAFRETRPKFRAEFLSSNDPLGWIMEDLVPEASSDQIAHAKAVLSRLAAFRA